MPQRRRLVRRDRVGELLVRDGRRHVVVGREVHGLVEGAVDGDSERPLPQPAALRVVEVREPGYVEPRPVGSDRVPVRRREPRPPPPDRVVERGYHLRLVVDPLTTPVLPVLLPRRPSVCPREDGFTCQTECGCAH